MYEPTKKEKKHAQWEYHTHVAEHGFRYDILCS